jgi:hypothetical protein
VTRRFCPLLPLWSNFLHPLTHMLSSSTT